MQSCCPECMSVQTDTGCGSTGCEMLWAHVLADCKDVAGSTDINNMLRIARMNVTVIAWLFKTVCVADRPSRPSCSHDPAVQDLDGTGLDFIETSAK